MAATVALADRVQLDRVHRWFLRPYVFAGTGLCVAAALVILARALYGASSPDTFRRKFAELALQLALIVVLGALVKLLVDSRLELRARVEQNQAKRLDLLRRIRAQHVQVAVAQRLIVAHGSGRTYTEQLRRLMLVTAEIEDIAEDVRAATGLFGKDGSSIVQGLEEIVVFLDCGAQEYVRCHAFVNADATAGKALSHTVAAQDMTWVKALRTCFPRFPEQYTEGLTASKGAMRRHVYGQQS